MAILKLFKWLKKFFNWLLLGFSLIIVLVLAFANSQRVTFSLDPFASDTAFIAFELPLFAIIMGALMIGVLIGGVMTRINIWKKQRNTPK